MRKININEIYVCAVTKQCYTYLAPGKGGPRAKLLGVRYFWSLDNFNSWFGLFVKKDGQYMHLLSNKFYPFPSQYNDGKNVINPEKIEKLSQKEPELLQYLKDRFDPNNIPLSFIAFVEENINEKYNKLRERENCLGEKVIALSEKNISKF